MLDTLRRLGRRLLENERAASTLEYCLLLALIAVVCFGAVTYFGNGSGNSVTNSCDRIRVATDSAGSC